VAPARQLHASWRVKLLAFPRELALMPCVEA
jgi:hypothetical protein